MKINLLILSLLIANGCTSIMYGAHINRRTKNNIQYRQARQIKVALHKLPEKKRRTDKEKTIAAIEALRWHTPGIAAWRYQGFMKQVKRLQSKLQAKLDAKLDRECRCGNCIC